MVQITLKAKEAFLLNLKAIMDERSLSQSDVAKLVGFSQQQVSNIFNGKNNLTLNTTEKIADALGVEETDMFNPKYRCQLIKSAK